MKNLLPLFVFFLLTLSALASEPRIEVSDLDFDVLGVGVQGTRQMTICNTGTGQLTFTEGPGGKFIQWLRTSRFNVTTAEMEKLRTAVLDADGCINIEVTFSSDVEGEYRDTAHVFANTSDRKDWSAWHAIVRQPGPRLNGYDWGKQWVVTPVNICTKNTATGYPGEAELRNEGTGSFSVQSITVAGSDASYFTLDMSDPATTINPGDQVIKDAEPKKQRMIFRPAGERSYVARLGVVTRDPLNGQMDTVYTELRGTGIESHISVADTDFGQVAPGSTRTIDFSIVAHPTRRTTITDIAIAGADAADFRFGPSVSLPTVANPWVLEPGTTRDISIGAEPRSSAPTSALLILTGDFSRCDDSVAVLSVNGTSSVEDGDISSGNALLRVDRSGEITLRLAHAGSVTIEIFTSAGEQVAYANRRLDAGEQTIALDPLRSGVYYVRASSGSWSDVRGFVVP
jgi:hypothetical protein